MRVGAITNPARASQDTIATACAGRDVRPRAGGVDHQREHRRRADAHADEPDERDPRDAGRAGQRHEPEPDGGERRAPAADPGVAPAVDPAVVGQPPDGHRAGVQDERDGRDPGREAEDVDEVDGAPGLRGVLEHDAQQAEQRDRAQQPQQPRRVAQVDRARPAGPSARARPPRRRGAAAPTSRGRRSRARRRRPRGPRRPGCRRPRRWRPSRHRASCRALHQPWNEWRIDRP